MMRYWPPGRLPAAQDGTFGKVQDGDGDFEQARVERGSGVGAPSTWATVPHPGGVCWKIPNTDGGALMLIRACFPGSRWPPR